MISDFKALPSLYVNQENAVLHALLHHFAKVSPTKANELQDELAVEEAGGVAFRHSEAQLVALIATHTSRLTPFEISAAERGPTGGGKQQYPSSAPLLGTAAGENPYGDVNASQKKTSVVEGGLLLGNRFTTPYSGREVSVIEIDMSTVTAAAEPPQP